MVAINDALRGGWAGGVTGGGVWYVKVWIRFTMKIKSCRSSPKVRVSTIGLARSMMDEWKRARIETTQWNHLQCHAMNVLWNLSKVKWKQHEINLMLQKFKTEANDVVSEVLEPAAEAHCRGSEENKVYNWLAFFLFESVVRPCYCRSLPETCPRIQNVFLAHNWWVDIMACCVLLLY